MVLQKIPLNLQSLFISEIELEFQKPALADCGGLHFSVSTCSQIIWVSCLTRQKSVS